MTSPPTQPLGALGNGVRGSTELLLVLADPVAQVKAPELFNRVFASHGVDTVVLPMQVRAPRLAAFVEQSLAVGNVRGLLVSIPHKTALASLLTRLDPVARAAGAVNAVRLGSDGRLEGALFDGAGFLGALAHHGVDCNGRRALLLGAGGAGLAIASALAGSGLAHLAVYDHQAARIAELLQRVAPASTHPLLAAASADPAGFDLVIQATPLGLRPEDPLPLDPQRLDRRAVVMDILMTRQPTALLLACRERGISAHAGHEMLVQQVPAYLEFFGYTALAHDLRSQGSAGLQDLRRHITAA